MGFLLSPLPLGRAPQLPGRGVPRPQTPSEAAGVQPCSLPAGSAHGPTAPPANLDEIPDFIPARCPLPPRFLWEFVSRESDCPLVFPHRQPSVFLSSAKLAATCPSAFHFPNFVAIFFSPIIFVLMFFIVIFVLFITFMFIHVYCLILFYYFW